MRRLLLPVFGALVLAVAFSVGPALAHSIVDASAPSSGASGWATDIDCDLTAQGTQTLSADGTYTFCGLTWTKINSASDASPTTLSASGLTFTPNSSSDYFASTVTAPSVRLSLSSLIPSLRSDMPVRVWAYVSAQNAGASFDSATIALESQPTAASLTNYALELGWTTNAAAGWMSQYNSNGSNVGQVAASGSPFNGYNVGVVESNVGLGVGMATFLAGTWSSGWPSWSSLRQTAQSGPPATIGSSTFINGSNTYDVLLGAHRAGSGTAFAATFARVRIEHHP